MKFIPVLIDVLPVPSRFTDTKTLVSLVFRLIDAFLDTINLTDYLIFVILNLIPLVVDESNLRPK